MLLLNFKACSTTKAIQSKGLFWQSQICKLLKSLFLVSALVVSSTDPAEFAAEAEFGVEADVELAGKSFDVRLRTAWSLFWCLWCLFWWFGAWCMGW